MGWQEFRQWLGAMHRQQDTRTDPGSWDGVESDPNWQALHRERDQLMGR